MVLTAAGRRAGAAVLAGVVLLPAAPAVASASTASEQRVGVRTPSSDLVLSTAADRTFRSRHWRVVDRGERVRRLWYCYRGPVLAPDCASTRVVPGRGTANGVLRPAGSGRYAVDIRLLFPAQSAADCRAIARDRPVGRVTLTLRGGGDVLARSVGRIRLGCA